MVAFKQAASHHPNPLSLKLFRKQGSKFKVQGSGFRAQDSGFQLEL
jgi:hypothetical protein